VRCRGTPGALNYLGFLVVSVLTGSSNHRTVRSYPSGRSSFRTGGRFPTFPALDPGGPDAARPHQLSGCVTPSPVTSLTISTVSRVGQRHDSLCPFTDRAVMSGRCGCGEPGVAVEGGVDGVDGANAMAVGAEEV
jgi:hypothetical protein